jgi:hypothetical protein
MIGFVPNHRIEASASELLRRYRLGVNFNVERLLDALDIGLLWEDQPEPDVLAKLVPSLRRVAVNEKMREVFERNHGLYRFTLSHEIGHWFLHCEAARAGNLTLFDEPGTWCRGGSREPIEIQAETFAGFLLIPTDELRSRVPKEDWFGWRPVYDLANSFGVSPSAMIVRLCQANLAFRDDSGTPRAGRRPQPGQLALGISGA